MKTLLLLALSCSALGACESWEEPKGFVARIAVAPPSMELEVGQTGRVTVTVDGVSDPELSFEISNVQVASVEQDPEAATSALVTALSPGQTTLEVSVLGTSLIASSHVVVLPE